MGFQDPGSDWMLAIIDLHDNIIFYLIILFTLIIWIFISAMLNKDHLAYLEHGNLIEIIWTITPAIILWAIGIPSLKLLYMMDEIIDAELTVKAQGSQWFWSYEYSDYGSESINYDSYLINYDDLELGQLRQLDVDAPLVLPINTSIRLLVSSNDVIHSYAIPSLAIKCDALPGRINSLGLTISRPSMFYGQCSELCGQLHAFMPCVIKAVNLPEYINFIKSASA